MDIDQTVINIGFAGFGALASFVLNALWSSVKDLQKDNAELARMIASVDKVVAGGYVPRDEFLVTVKAMFDKLDRIEDKVSNKADRV